jgi:hypothetical protein
MIRLNLASLMYRVAEGCVSQVGAKTMDGEIIFLGQKSDKGGYEAKALGHSIFTEADTYEDLKKVVQDAVVCHFEPESRPRLVRLFVVKEETLTV